MLEKIDERNLICFYNLAQAYEAEFSLLTNKKPNRDGLFNLDTVPKPPIAGFLWFEDLSPIAFILFDLSTEPYNVNEFYVIPSFRRKKIGEKLFFSVLRTYKGYWQVKQIYGAEQARTFWRKTIDKYTNGDFKEEIYQDSTWGEVTRQLFRAC